jgi:glutathione S-transferase
MTHGTLYGVPPSRAARVTWLASELGIDLDVKPVNIMEGEHKKPEFTAINVLQQIPAFTDDDVSMGESLAITLYLSRKYTADVCPKSLAEEAAVLQWTMIAASVDGQVAPIMTHRIMLPEDKRDNEAVEKTMKALKRALAGVERHLAAGNDYLVGNRLTVADINMAGATSVLHFTGLSADIGPHFLAWLARCLDRPAAKRDIIAPKAPPPHMIEHFMKMIAEQ